MKKCLIAVFIIVAVALGGVYFYNSNVRNETTNAVEITATISIKGLEGQIILIPQTEIIKEGTTALIFLKDVAKKNNITISVAELAGFGEYVTGIDNLNAGDNGEMSGWIYKINQESPNVGMGNYELKNGDILDIEYITSY